MQNGRVTSGCQIFGRNQNFKYRKHASVYLVSKPLPIRRFEEMAHWKWVLAFKVNVVSTITLPPSCAVVMKSGNLNSWNPLGHSRPVTGLLYLVSTINLLFNSPDSDKNPFLQSKSNTYWNIPYRIRSFVLHWNDPGWYKIFCWI